MLNQPLRFIPIIKRYLWGGDRLGQWLGKPCGGQTAAESWELVDHLDGQSIVAEGQYAGITITELLARQGADILGDEPWRKINQASVPDGLRGRFPLLFKFLDAHQVLSVQVHPSDSQAAKLNPPDLGKTEAWYILHAEPDSKIYAGLRPEVGKAAFSQAADQQNIEALLHSFNPRAGDLVFIPAGTIHALGAGLVVAEIQQASNTTFRLYDWNRVDDRGNPRPLHIRQALDVIDFDRGPVNPMRFAEVAAAETNGTIQSLVCDKFRLNRRRIITPSKIAGDGQMRILVNLAGKLMIENDPADRSLNFAETILLPASLQTVRIEPLTTAVEYLEILLP